MVWGEGTGVLKLPSTSGLPIESIVPSPDKSGVFPCFSDVTPFIVSSIFSPYFDKFYPDHPPPPSPPSEGSLMVFTKLVDFLYHWLTWFDCLFLRDIWDQTGTALSWLFFFFFDGEVFGEYCLVRLPHWVVLISSGWHKDNDISRPEMGKIIIYHVQSCSELFRTVFQKTNGAMWLYLTLVPTSPMHGTCESQIKYNINITHLIIFRQGGY